MKRELHTKLSQLYSELAVAHAQLAAAAGDEYVDQHKSPLGSRLHCRLARCGTLTGYRAGRRILIRLADIEAFLKTRQVQPTEPAVGKLDEDEALLAKLNTRAA